MVRAETDGSLLSISENGLKDWLPLDAMTLGELGSYMEIIQNRLLSSGDDNEQDEELISANELYSKLEKLSSSITITNENLSEEELNGLRQDFQRVFEGLDMEIGFGEIVNEFNAQTKNVNRITKLLMYLIPNAADLSTKNKYSEFDRLKEKMLRIIIQQLKTLLESNKISNFVSIKRFVYIYFSYIYFFIYIYMYVYIHAHTRILIIRSFFLGDEEFYFGYICYIIQFILYIKEHL